MVYTDARNAALRALRANEIGRTLTENPHDRGAVLAREYPNNPGINRSRGDYEYRVVVRGEGLGQEFETLVYVRSRNRLSGEEVGARATRAFNRNEGLHRSYKRQIEGLGQSPSNQWWIVSASRNTG